MKRGEMVVAAIVAVMPACSLFVDLSDLSDGGAPSAGGGDASFSDGSSDAADARGATDSGSVDASDGSMLAFCAAHSTATFCSDFDETDDHESVPTPWTDYEGLDDGGTDLELDDAEVRSPPHSLYAFTHGGGDDVDLYAKLAPFFASAHFEADFYVDSAPTTGAVAPISIAAELTPNDHYALLYLSSGNVYLQNGDSTGMSQIIAETHAAISAGWHHVAIDVKIAAAASSVSVTVDGTALGTDVSMPYSFSGMAHAYVYVGAVGVYQAAPFTTRIDNVLFDAN